MDSATVAAMANAVTDPAEVSKVWAYAATWWGLAILLGVFVTQWLKVGVYVLKFSDDVENALVCALAYTITGGLYVFIRFKCGFPVWELPTLGGAMAAAWVSPYADRMIKGGMKRVLGIDLDAPYSKLFPDGPKPPDVPLPPAGGAA